MSELLHLLPYLCSVFVTGLVAVYGFRRKDVRFARLLGWFAAFMTLSTVAFVLEIVSPTIEAKMFWDSVQWPFNSSITVVVVLLTKEYAADRWKYPRLILGLVVLPPAALAVFYLSSYWHGLAYIYPRLVDSTPFDGLIYKFSIGFFLFAGYLYIVQVMAISRMVLLLKSPHKRHRIQVVLMSCALAAPLALGTLTVFEFLPPAHRNITPFSYALSAGLMALGIFRYQMFDAIPLARSLVVDAMAHGFVVVDKAGKIVDYNDAAIPLFVGGHRSYLGMDAHKYIPVWADTVKHGESCCEPAKPAEFQYSSKQGDFQITVVPIQNGKNELQAHLLTIHDFSDQKAIERALQVKSTGLEQDVDKSRQLIDELSEQLADGQGELADVLAKLQNSEETYRLLFELSDAGIVIRGQEFEVLRVNKSMLKIFGMTREEFCQKTPKELVAPDYQETLKAGLKQLEENGEMKFNCRAIRKNGTKFDFNIRTQGFDVGGARHFFSVMLDLSTLQRTQQQVRIREVELASTHEQLQQSEESYRTIFELGTAGISIRDIEGKLISANQELLRMFGTTFEDYSKIPVDKLATSGNEDVVRVFKEQLLAKGLADIEVSFERQDGIIVDISGSAKIVKLHGVPRIITMVQDVTELKKALNSAQDTHKRFRRRGELLSRAMDVAKLAHWTLDAETERFDASPEFFQMFNIEPHDATLESIVSILDPDADDGLLETVRSAIKEGAPFEVDHVLDVPNETQKNVHCTANIIKIGDGDSNMYFGISQDVTAEHTAGAHRESLLAQVTELKNELELERDYLRQELFESASHDSIVGGSEGARQMLTQIDAVSGTDASVLIQGPSGVGKELVATAIHEKSNRGYGPLIKVNCASIPAELFESEFFGHCLGAFSGATRDRMGRFQAADGGTIFLDEVGEIPLNLQSKLLRVLQEGEFERVGEEKTRKVDVRVIAATNRDLKSESEEGNFRSDLYFRLSVFPLTVPTLAERKEDIVPLAMHFIAQVCNQNKREQLSLTRKQALDLTEYEWPGNIRELKHVIERAIILSKGDRLRLDLALKSSNDSSRLIRIADNSEERGFMTDTEMRDLERRNILAVMKATNWVVAGPEGAATMLGMKSTTLASRMKSMGINKPTKKATV